MAADHRLRLTQSWRFGQAVADEANVWLDVVGTDMRINGNPAKTSTVGSAATPDAVLCRSNAGTILEVLAAHAAGTPVHLVGDGREMLGLARAAEEMLAGKPANRPEVVAFCTWPEVVDYATHDPSGTDLATAVGIIEKFGANEVVAAIEGTVPAASAKVIVSIAHKAKGLEWRNVAIGADFREPIDRRTGEPLPVPLPDAMLGHSSSQTTADI